MNLRNLVGKTAIRTAEAFNPEPFPPVHFVFNFPVPSPKPGSTRKYMDEPVKIINVKEDQVVIEEHGERKLLERRYIDNHWIDYDKFLHPENTPSYTAGHEYTLQVELKVRTGPGTNYNAKKHTQLTADGQKHDKDNDGCLDAGTVVTCQEVRNVGNDIWMKAPSGWMAAYYDGKVYIK